MLINLDNCIAEDEYGHRFHVSGNAATGNVTLTSVGLDKSSTSISQEKLFRDFDILSSAGFLVQSNHRNG